MDKLAFIWDLDGTLLDSYRTIVSCMHQTLREFGIDREEEEIHKEIITYSTGVYFSKTEKETGVTADTLKKRFAELSDGQFMKIRPVRNAAEILDYLKREGIPNYVFTHKGASTEPALKNIGLYDYFDEIITGNDGFPKKPDPAAVNHLVRKYGLRTDRTFFVGDRTIDILCAVNAGIRSIMYLPEDSLAEPTGKETYVVKDLMEIRDIAEKERAAYS